MHAPAFRAALVAVLALAACGGDDDSPPPPPPNHAPIAGTSSSQTVPPGMPALLDGRGSWDQDGDPLTYAWTLEVKPAGSAATILGATAPQALIIPDVAGVYVLSLVVSDGEVESPPAFTFVVASASAPPTDPNPTAPIARPGTGGVIPSRVPRTLDGTASTDPLGRPLSFLWTLVQRPDGSAAGIENPTRPTASFTPDRDGTYVVGLTVTAENGPAGAATLSLDARDLPPVPVVTGPEAVYAGGTVNLDGTASADPNGDPFTPAWSLVAVPAGSAATALDGAATLRPSFVADVAGEYTVRLEAGGGSATWVVRAYPPARMLAHRVLDAEFSKALDALVMVDEAPNALYRYDVASGTERSVALPLTPSSVSVAPSGLFAAVGHDGHVSYVDLEAMTVTKVLPISIDVLDVVLAGNGYAYGFPRRDQWAEIHCLQIETGGETTSAGWSIYAGTVARLHPGGTAMYGADNGLSPSDIEKYDISGGTARYLYDSPYHGDYAMCGDLWFSEDGARIFTACGNVFRATSTQATDMTYNGALQGMTAVQHLSHSRAAGEVAAVGWVPWYGGTGHEDEVIRLFDDAFLTARPNVPVTPVIGGGKVWTGKGRYVFHRADGLEGIAIVQAEAASGMLHDFALQSF
jgi:hypothetical protein